jgi:hypothetical protein
MRQYEAMAISININRSNETFMLSPLNIAPLECIPFSMLESTNLGSDKAEFTNDV